MRIIPTSGIIGLLLLIASPVFGGQTYNPQTGRYDLCSTIQQTGGTPANVSCGPVNVSSLTDNGNGTYTVNSNPATPVSIANGGTNSSTALSGSSIMVSNGSAIVQGSAGTTTTLLHGNAAGAPTYSAVSLTADVSGALPIANGGTNNTVAYSTGSVIFSDGITLAQNNVQLFWDNVNMFLGLGTTASPQATLDVQGSLRTIATSTSVNLSLTTAHQTILATTGAGGITLTLPAATANTVGLIYHCVKVDAGAGLLTIAAAATNTINGVASKTLATRYAAARVVGISATEWAAESLGAL